MKWGDSLIPPAARPPVPVYISPVIDSAIRHTIAVWRAGVTWVLIDAAPWGGLGVGWSLMLLALWGDWRHARAQTARVVPSRDTAQELNVETDEPLAQSDDEPTTVNGAVGMTTGGVVATTSAYTPRHNSHVQGATASSVASAISTRSGPAAPKLLPAESPLGLKPKSVAAEAFRTSYPAAAPTVTGDVDYGFEAKE